MRWGLYRLGLGLWVGGRGGRVRAGERRWRSRRRRGWVGRLLFLGDGRGGTVKEVKLVEDDCVI